MYEAFSIQFKLNGRFRLKLVKYEKIGSGCGGARESKGSIEGVEESSEEVWENRGRA